MKNRIRFLSPGAFLFLVCMPELLLAASGVQLNGYAEWKQGDVLVVEGQRVIATPSSKFKGSGAAKSFATIPLGYEVKVKGDRRADGTVLAKEIEAKPNGDAMYEKDLKQAFDQMETQYKEKGHMVEQQSEGKVADMGELKTSGPEVDRVRRITAKIVPPYMKVDDFRVYVVVNNEWNAMAAPNCSIYVFSGLLKDMDDDEIAIILGHELVHATHEHSRKQYKKSLWINLGASSAASVSNSAVGSETTKEALGIATQLGASAFTNGYSREYEDQADRVGLRYAYQAGYNVQKGPLLWAKFAKKYGDSDKATNFFFGNHSVASDRQRNLERELQINYPAPH